MAGAYSINSLRLARDRQDENLNEVIDAVCLANENGDNSVEYFRQMKEHGLKIMQIAAACELIQHSLDMAESEAPKEEDK